MESVRIAVVFPGQGSQRSGMGKDFYDQVSASRLTYEEASDALGWDVAALCFRDDERLNLTEYTQPCIVTTEIAMLRGLTERYGFVPTYFGGHSLGELTALVAAGVVSLSRALKVVQARGRLMQTAVPVGVGGMAAVISSEINLEVIRRALSALPIDVANINSSDQVVISGQAWALPDAHRALLDVVTGGQPLRFVPLNVSAPFHSRFMKPVEDPFADTLRGVLQYVDCEKAKMVTSNYTGGFHSGSAEQIVNNLVAQVSNTVQWKNNMTHLAAIADAVYEVGPGRPLRDFFKTVGVTCQSVVTLSGAERVFNPGSRPQPTADRQQ
ncbi:MAG: ACP S-malonyltransferase [Syntrophobacterales bacterium]|nr:ACP S-malonyltransferase [Syntrophobacterales bacterium]